MTIITNMDTESRPIKWVFDEFKKGNLFVDESFQRNYIWIQKDRVALLETILLGYPIPEIYLWETGSDPTSGDIKYSIVDGQQRIRTIGQFIDGLLKLVNSGLEFQDPAYKGKLFGDLDPAIRSNIWSYKISVRFIKQAVDREDIVKMFLRLNKTSNALNPQELRNAEFHGEFLKASATVASNGFWKKWNLFSDADIRRMSDIQFISTLFIFVRSGFEDETTQSAINKVYDLLNDEYPEKDSDIRKITDTLDYLDILFTNNPSLATVLTRKTHLYSVFTVCFVVKDKTKLNSSNLSKLFTDWYSWYDQDTNATSEWLDLVDEYRRLSQEGVQKKANRLARFTILEKYIDASS
jgi:uncharacterized protein with ParB-like and HNH nuclease domain